MGKGSEGNRTFSLFPHIGGKKFGWEKVPADGTGGIGKLIPIKRCAVPRLLGWPATLFPSHTQAGKSSHGKKFRRLAVHGNRAAGSVNSLHSIQ